MPVFFQTAAGNMPAGRTVAMADPHAAGSVSVVRTEPSISYVTEKSIITRMTLSHKGNFQLLHTMGNDIQIYVFGDRIGSITISGLSMAYDCTSDDGRHGFEKILEWYQNNRLAARRDPVIVTIGSNTVINGFVAGVTGDVVDPSTRLVQYGLQLLTLPEKDE